MRWSLCALLALAMCTVARAGLGNIIGGALGTVVEYDDGDAEACMVGSTTGANEPYYVSKSCSDASYECYKFVSSTGSFEEKGCMASCTSGRTNYGSIRGTFYCCDSHNYCNSAWQIVPSLIPLILLALLVAMAVLGQ